MKYDVDEPNFFPEKDHVLNTIGAAVTLPACAEARRLRSDYLRKYGRDWDVLAAADMLDRVETILDHFHKSFSAPPRQGFCIGNAQPQNEQNSTYESGLLQQKDLQPKLADTAD